MSDEQQVRLKPPGEGGSVSYYHAGLGIGASQDNPIVSVSDSAYDTLLETGKFEAADDGDEVAAEDVVEASTEDESNSDDTADDGEAIDSEAFNHDEHESESNVESNAAPEGEGAETDICGAEMSSGEICHRPADECPYHQDEDAEDGVEDEDEDEDAKDEGGA